MQPSQNPGNRRSDSWFKWTGILKNSLAQEELKIRPWTVNRQPTRKVCTECTTCRTIIYGLPESEISGFNDKKTKFMVQENMFLSKSLGYDFNESNLQLIHYLHTQIFLVEDVFLAFDEMFNKYFKNVSEQRNLIQLQIYERIFLRIVFLKYKIASTRDAKVFEINNNDCNINLNAGFVSGSVKRRNADDLPLATNYKVKSSVEDFNKFSEIVYIYFNCHLEKIQKHFILKYLCGKITSMFLLTKNSPDFIFNRRNLAYNYLNYIKNLLDKDFQEIRDQRIQIFELCGKSGIGKSSAIQSLVHLVHALCQCIPLGDCIYTRANDYWWNGYCGQPIILYDDLTHIKQKAKFDLPFELIAVASGTFRNPPMAFEKDMIFTSSIVYITSNIPILTKTDGETQLALKRRIKSSVWIPLKGVREENENNSGYLFKGALLNSIWTANNQRSIFSTFSEILAIINEKENFDLIFEKKEKFVFDDEEELNSSQNTSLTSSVPKSHLDFAPTNNNNTKGTIRKINKEKFIKSMGTFDKSLLRF